MGQGADCVEDCRSQRLVDLDKGDGVLPGGGPAEVEGGNVDLGCAESVSQRADKAWLVVIAHEQHVAAELGFERNTLDRHEARLVATKQSAGDLPPASLGRDDDPDEGLIINGLGTPR